MVLKVSRRTFIWSAVGSSLALGAGGWALQVRATNSAEMIASIVRKRLNYLQLDWAGLLAFGADASTHLNDSQNERLEKIRLISPVYEKVDLLELSPRADKFRRLEDRLAKKFLMSSDFFSHNGDQNRTIRYVGYDDPYENPCSNPFAMFDPGT